VRALQPEQALADLPDGVLQAFDPIFHELAQVVGLSDFLLDRVRN